MLPDKSLYHCSITFASTHTHICVCVLKIVNVSKFSVTLINEPVNQYCISSVFGFCICRVFTLKVLYPLVYNFTFVMNY